MRGFLITTEVKFLLNHGVGYSRILYTKLSMYMTFVLKMWKMTFPKNIRWISPIYTTRDLHIWWESGML